MDRNSITIFSIFAIIFGVIPFLLIQTPVNNIFEFFTTDLGIAAFFLMSFMFIIVFIFVVRTDIIKYGLNKK